MRFDSRREPAVLKIIAGRRLSICLALAFSLSVLSTTCPPAAAMSVAEMARLEAGAEATVDGARTLFRGYMSMALLPEAVSALERRVRLGVFPAEAAAPLFEEAIAEQARFDDPAGIAALCEAAARSGVRTPMILYHHGTALRKLPGRIGDASGILATEGGDGPSRLLRLYSLGQASAARGETGTAAEIFLRVEEGAGGLERGGFLARRAARSRAGLLLTKGERDEAARIFRALTGLEANPLDRIGLAAAGADPVRDLSALPPETIAGMPLEDRVRFHLLFGGLAREAGRHEAAIARFDLAARELEDALSLPSVPVSESVAHSIVAESLGKQINGIKNLRQGLQYRDALPADATRAAVVELLVGLLAADRTAALAAPRAGRVPDARLLSAGDVAETVRRIEEVSLDGYGVDRHVERLSARLDTLQNMGHPIGRYRRLVRLEKSQKEIHRLKERIMERRAAAVAAVEARGDGDLPALLEDLGLFLVELDGIRAAADEARAFLREHFDILRRGPMPGDAAEDPFSISVREAIRFADGRMSLLLPAAVAVAEGSRAAGWERRKPRLHYLRAAVDRQLADALVGRAGRLRREPGEAARKESLAALGRAVSLAVDRRFEGEDAARVAIGAGSVLVEGKGRWETYPAPPADETEKGLIARILALLPPEGGPVGRGEEALHVDAVLRMRARVAGAEAAAGRYLERYPASALSAGVGLRLGHEAFLAGDIARAAARYRAALDSGDADASAVARYMLGWIRFRSGDSEGALRELAHPLSDPSFPCGDLSPPERGALSLAVRAGRGAPISLIESYPPVKEGGCAGKAFLAALWEAEETGAEYLRAAAVRDIAARRFPSDARAAELEVETVEALLRGGRGEEAFSRALKLRGKYGPGSGWAAGQAADVRERAAGKLAGMFRDLGERKFEEGIRTGGRAAHSLAAAMLGEHLLAAEGGPTVDRGEIRLKRAIALLASGGRKEGMRLLRELIAEGRGDAPGERAGILYTEAMIAGYERMEESAEDAGNAADFLLEKHPSAKAVELALRASRSLLAAREYGRARGTAEKAEKSRFAGVSQAREARLVQAESAVFTGDFAGAQGKAALALAAPDAGEGAAASARARDLYLLSSLKRIEEMSAAGDSRGAAAALEGLADRFPDAPERPTYLLRAMRLSRQGGDGEGAARVGARFLREYPRREEMPEAAGVVGPLLEERGDHRAAADLYESAAAAFPGHGTAHVFLFHAARLAEAHGPEGAASRRFSSWRSRYSSPAWMWNYATLSIGLEGWRGGDRGKSVRLLEEGLRKVDAEGGVEKDAPAELRDAAARARIAVGRTWADQFRGARLVIPLEKSLAIKDRFFRNALAAYGRAGQDAPLEVALQADLLSGDLFLEYGKAILDSQRPKGLSGADLDGYEEALKERARSFFERSVEWCSAALDRIEKAKGPPDLAEPVRKRLETAQALLEGTAAAKGEMTR